MSVTMSREARELLGAIDTQRRFLRQTVRGLADDQLGLRTSVSELCLGGILKHVAAVERTWVRFIVEGPSAFPPFDEASMAQRATQFSVGPADTVESVLAGYEEVALATAHVVEQLRDLDADHPLPEAPWFEPGARWSARQVLLHVLAETAQHSGHADIVREGIDGAKTMG